MKRIQIQDITALSKEYIFLDLSNFVIFYFNEKSRGYYFMVDNVSIIYLLSFEIWLKKETIDVCIFHSIHLLSCPS